MTASVCRRHWLSTGSDTECRPLWPNRLASNGVTSEPLHRFPDVIRVPLHEVRRLVGRLELLQRALHAEGQMGHVEAVDDIIGHVARWLWPLLDELEAEGT